MAESNLTPAEVRRLVAALNAARKSIVQVYLRSGGEWSNLQESADSIANAIQSIGGRVTDIKGY